MAAHERSLQVTDRYRQRLQALRLQAVTFARQRWADLDPQDLDGSHARWVGQVAPMVTELQRAGGTLSHAYLSAFLTSELGRHVSVQDAAVAVGRARDGRPLAEALVPSLYTIKQQIGDGQPIRAALTMGAYRAFRTVGEETVAPARDSLADGIRQDGRIIGWRRVTGGGCGACLAAATGAIQSDEEVLEVHDNCQCTKEPVIADVPDRVERPTGRQIFEGMDTSAQDQLLGPDKAKLIRDGAVPFHALVQHDPMAVIPDQITEAPLEALQHQH